MAGQQRNMLVHQCVCVRVHVSACFSALGHGRDNNNSSPFKPSLIAPTVVDDFLLYVLCSLKWKWPCHQCTVSTSSRDRRFEVFISTGVFIDTFQFILFLFFSFFWICTQVSLAALKLSQSSSVNFNILITV